MPVIDGIARREAVRLICSRLKGTLETEYLPLQEVCGRVVAEDVRSRLNLPDTPCSRWDGVSFNFESYVRNGNSTEGWLERVDYRLTNTGIGIFNDSFDTMVKVEDTEFRDGRLYAIRQSEPVERGQNVIPVGERMAIGEVLLSRNTLVRPSHLNLMASGGNLTVPVYRKPTVALLPSCDELVACSDTPLIGQTIESNTYSMRAKVEQWGGRALLYPILKDDTAALQRQLCRAAAEADIVVISGGSGRGRYDLLQAAIAEIGELYFSSVDHGPGKRTCFASVDGTPVIGVVGPPGGEEMTFDFYVVPAIRASLCQEHRETMLPAILDADAEPHPRVNFYFTLHVHRGEDHELHGRLLPHARLDRSIAEHNGYLYVPKGSRGYVKGDRVTVELRIGYENI